MHPRLRRQRRCGHGAGKPNLTAAQKVSIVVPVRGPVGPFRTTWRGRCVTCGNDVGQAAILVADPGFHLRRKPLIFITRNRQQTLKTALDLSRFSRACISSRLIFRGARHQDDSPTARSGANALLARKSVTSGHSRLPKHRGQIRHWRHRVGWQRQHVAIPILPKCAEFSEQAWPL